MAKLFSAALVAAAACLPLTADAAPKHLFYWEKGAKFNFCTNFRAGHEADGRPLYISQTVHDTKIGPYDASYRWHHEVVGGWEPVYHSIPKPRAWHLGKAGAHLKDGMTYSYGGREYNVKRGAVEGRQYGHDVFCLTHEGLNHRHKFHWVSAFGGMVPEGAISGYNRHEEQKICRAKWSGGLHPGKLLPNQACLIGYGGSEETVEDYEVLVFRP